MDRFIVRELSIHSIRFYNLKSSMDRFIERKDNLIMKEFKNLKSSMDRFIDVLCNSMLLTEGI